MYICVNICICVYMYMCICITIYFKGSVRGGVRLTRSGFTALGARSPLHGRSVCMGAWCVEVCVWVRACACVRACVRVIRSSARAGVAVELRVHALVQREAVPAVLPVHFGRWRQTILTCSGSKHNLYMAV